MAPSSTTPNFSRPLPSPMSIGVLGSPVKISKRQLALRELPNSASLAGMPHAVQAKEPSPSKRVFDTATNTHVQDKPADTNTRKGASTDESCVVQHNRRLSNSSLKSASASSVSDRSVDLGGLDKPISNFRPYLWRLLERERDVLNLDLFWPIKVNEESDEDEEDDENGDSNGDGDPKGVFPFKDLKPLTEFRHLRHLQLNGMMRSYQPLIWATCWVNKDLTRVHLEMALEPVINEDIMHKYRNIDRNWIYDRLSITPVDCEYLGSHGDGTLHEEFGEGEYLDQQAMKAAQINMVRTLPLENLRYLPITHLTLMNFVVDGGPFFRWFDPNKLKEINFRGDCIDAGFSLPHEMKLSVRVTSPKPPPAARWVKPGEVKLIDINRPKTASTSASGCGSGGSVGLKGKLNQMMPKWVAKSKDKDSKTQDKVADQEVQQLEQEVSRMGLRE
ncbi:hypothetical protein A1O1_00986 [Capronia coronata CBS 617.96]|uniref:Uncharacterized protein n=1 Tax=Capronia coronata CBS 617.96 TaxID=1182541 RepID=W9Z2T6_9EURO|nr:uncharacterized protein A1O1_00986 [Capronia coronata CBS 617.96]EXJ95861.1 hypothetical protein A1O1_00986 [Capronia coronata CBS 617.96]